MMNDLYFKGLGFVTFSMPIYQPFNADHAFLYYILDSKANTIIFNGRFVRTD